MLKYFYSVTVVTVLILFPGLFLYKELYETLGKKASIQY